MLKELLGARKPINVLTAFLNKQYILLTSRIKKRTITFILFEQFIHFSRAFVVNK